MANNIHLVLSYAAADAPLARQLTEQLLQKNIEVSGSLDELKIVPGQDISELRVVLLVIVSGAAATDSKVLADIEMAKRYGWKILPVKQQKSPAAGLLKNLHPFVFEHLVTGQFQQFLQAAGILHLFNVQSPAPAGKDRPDIIPAPSKPKKGFFRNIIDAVNPFNAYRSSKAKKEEYEYEMAGAAPADDEEDTAARGSKNVYPEQPSSYKSAPAPQAPQEPAPQTNLPAANKGKVLYDIPDKMVVNQPKKCLVRLGKTEAIVRDDDTFSPSVKIEAVPIYKVMAVDLVDIAEPPKFSIKCISAPEQIIEDDSYSEWVFMVTPLASGTGSLFVKVSVIKIIDGKERRKELVFEKPVDITATDAPANAGIIQTLIPASTPATVGQASQPLKDLLNEKEMKEMDPPVVFISYAHKDEPYFAIFADYLKMHSSWTIWTDRSIKIGADWFEAIQEAIKESDIAVLLISAGFISSGFIKENEFKKFADLQKQKPGFIFLPILLGDVDFTRWQELAAMQLFSAKGPDYGLPKAGNELMPFAKLCRFDNDGVLIPNDYINTYFKNLVKKAEKDWLGKGK